MTPETPFPAGESLNTSTSLLVRVKARDEAAWRRLANLYGPLIYRWIRKAGLQSQDALDVVQNVFLAVASRIDQFRRDRPTDSLRGWLWTISRHKVLDHFRERKHRELAQGGSACVQFLEQIPGPASDPNEAEDELCRLRHRALALLSEEFDKHVWQAFLRTVVYGDHPTDVAHDLGISVATVYRAKFRVLKRLQAELGDE